MIMQKQLCFLNIQRKIQLILKSLLRIHIAVEILKELLEDLKEHGWRSGISRYVIQVYIAKVGVIE